MRYLTRYVSFKLKFYNCLHLSLFVLNTFDESSALLYAIVAEKSSSIEPSDQKVSSND